MVRTDRVLPAGIKKIRVGVICPSEIAIRRFMPSLKKIEGVSFAGIGVSRSEERFGHEKISDSELNGIIEQERKKALGVTEQYGGKVFGSYEDVITSAEVDAVYIPLPPALHYFWAKRAMENGKHVLVEKPATISLQDTFELVKTAKSMDLALHENYMFTFHSQISSIDDILKSGEIGDIRLFRISFGFPLRSKNDFRYDPSLGGGALIDAGGYVLKYAAYLLGGTAKIKSAQMDHTDGFKVDMFGSGTLVNADGVTAQVSYGMDNQYKCELEVWGSKGTLFTGRVLTAPSGFVPKAVIHKGNETVTVDLPEDDAFERSICYFLGCMSDKLEREKAYQDILAQAELVEAFSQTALGMK